MPKGAEKREDMTLLEEISSRTNVEMAFDYVVKHLEGVRQRERWRGRRDAVCTEVAQALSEGRFAVRGYREMTVRDGGKAREVQAPSVRDRVGCHAVMVKVEEVMHRALIRNTAASIKGKGMHWLHHIVEEDIRQHGLKYYYKCDVVHFYDSIPQERMKEVVRRYVEDEGVLRLLDGFIEMMPRGLSKGLRSSQCLANVYLDEVDKLMTQETAWYYRYCDDMVLMSHSKRALWQQREKLVAAVRQLGLEIHSNDAVRPLTEGLDYLGYVHYPTHSLLRKRVKQNAARKLARLKNERRRVEVIGALKGMAVHADCKHLFYKLTGKRMQKFGDLGVTYIPKDGKKRFNGAACSLSSIQNVLIEVWDYERDIKTRQGDGRYLVSFKDSRTGEWGKFFTASEEMKSILDAVAARGDGFPFETVIVSERFDGTKMRYRFT